MVVRFKIIWMPGIIFQSQDVNARIVDFSKSFLNVPRFWHLDIEQYQQPFAPGFDDRGSMVYDFSQAISWTSFPRELDNLWKSSQLRQLWKPIENFVQRSLDTSRSF